MLRRKLTKILIMVLNLALLMTALPANGVLAAGETVPTIYDFDSKYITDGITVDGMINEADWDISRELNQGITSITNNTAKFGTLWDTSMLYIAFDVTDASIVNSNSADGPWNDDSVEVYIDGDNTKMGYNESIGQYSGDAHSVQYIFKWNDPTVYIFNNLNATASGVQFVSRLKDDGTGYTMEIAIPWISINGLTVNSGDAVGITAHMNDRDDDGLGNETSVTFDCLGYSANFSDDWKSAVDWPNMRLSSDIFEDDCSDLSSWNYTQSNNIADELYVTDSSNPISPEPTAAAGEFKFYANAVNTIHDSAVDIYKPITLTDSENWTINANMKIDSLQKIGAGLEDYDGFIIKMIPSTEGRYIYILFSEDGVRVRNSSTPAVPINTIGDGKYHDYSFTWNPASTELLFAVDGAPAATFTDFATDTGNGGLFMMTMTNYNRETSNTGVSSVYVNSASITRLPPVNPDNLVDSSCDGISAEGWAVSGGDGTAVLNDTERAGSFYLYSDSALRDDSTKAISKNIELSHSETWSLDMNIQIDNLRWIYDDYKGYYGLNINVADGEKQFKILFTQDGVSVNKNNDYATATIPLPAGIVGDGKYHKYSFAWDGVKNLKFAVDGVKIGSFTDIGLSNSGKFFSIKSDNYMAGDGTAPNQPSGEQKAYIDSISLTKNTTPKWALYNSKIKFINILPESDAANIKAMMVMEEIPEDMINNDEYEVQVGIFAKDNLTTLLVTANSPVAGEKFVLNVPGVSPDVLYTIKAQLINKTVNVVMNSYERDCRLDADVETIGKDGIVTGTKGITYLYTDVKCMAEAAANWCAGTYSYDGITNYDYVESKDGAGAIELPVTGTGKYAVYVGYMNGTEEFKVSNSTAESGIVVISQSNRTPHSEMTLYGARSLEEVFATVVDFSAGGKFSVIPVAGAYARIAYIRLKPMTGSDIALWNRKGDGKNRLVYNNDGFSDFYSGYYSDENGNPDVQNLLDSAMNRYSGKNVAALDWSLGTTLAINQASEFCSTELFENINKVMTGNSEEITDMVKRQEAEAILTRLRSGDKIAIKAFLGYINSNTSPLQLLETRGDELGIDVNVSIRMEAFYDPAGDDRWLNGTDYSEFTRVKAADGSLNSELSLADTKFQDYIINVLSESVTRYGADGVNLDFDRYPYVLGYELADFGYNISTAAKLYKAKSDVVTKFMRRVRAELPEGTAISARIPINEFGDQFGTGRGYKDNGLDFVSWTKEGLIDVLIPCDISYEEFHSLTPFVDAVNAANKKGKNVTLYCGITNDLGGHDLTKDEEDLINQGIKVDSGSKSVTVQQYRLRALEAYKAGAECIYVFNAWKGGNTLDYIGDKVELEKWYGLGYEADAVQNLATVTTSSDIGDTAIPEVAP